MQRKIGVISPSLPLKSEEEVETAVKRLENYGVSVEFFTTNDKLQDFMQAQVNELCWLKQEKFNIWGRILKL